MQSLGSDFTGAGLAARLGARGLRAGAKAAKTRMFPAHGGQTGQPAASEGQATEGRSQATGRLSAARLSSSRLSYRLERLWLTPMVRAMLRFGLPVLVVMLALGWYVSDANRVEAVRLWAIALRDRIEHRPEFMVGSMKIENASAELADDIREVTAIDFPISSFDIDLADMRARIEGLDAVARADLAIRPGGILEVKVVERIPAVVWRGRDSLELLDAAGHRVAAVESRRARADLRLIAGEGADRAVPEALELYRVAAPIEGRIRGLLRVGERRWDMILDRGQRIMLPERGAVAALRRVLALDEMNDLLSRDVKVVDFRDAARPTLRLSGNALKYLDNVIRRNGEGKKNAGGRT